MGIPTTDGGSCQFKVAPISDKRNRETIRINRPRQGQLSSIADETGRGGQCPRREGGGVVPGHVAESAAAAVRADTGSQSDITAAIVVQEQGSAGSNRDGARGAERGRILHFNGTRREHDIAGEGVRHVDDQGADATLADTGRAANRASALEGVVISRAHVN